MWHALKLSLALVLFCATVKAQSPGQVSTTSDPEAISSSRQAMTVLTNGTVITDVTISGTVTQIAGSQSTTGPATFKALAYGKSRLELSSGYYTVRTLDTNGHSIGASGKPGSAAMRLPSHAVQTDPVWFFPALTSISMTSQPNIVATYLGSETRQGISAKHLRFSRQANNTNTVIANTIRLLSTVDVYLDATTSLPLALCFNGHSRKDMNTNIPIEVRYSDYRQVNDAKVPFHLQEYLNNSLILDFQATNVTINSGLTDAHFDIP